MPVAPDSWSDRDVMRYLAAVSRRCRGRTQASRMLRKPGRTGWSMSWSSLDEGSEPFAAVQFQDIGWPDCDDDGPSSFSDGPVVGGFEDAAGRRSSAGFARPSALSLDRRMVEFAQDMLPFGEQALDVVAQAVGWAVETYGEVVAEIAAVDPIAFVDAVNEPLAVAAVAGSQAARVAARGRFARSGIAHLPPHGPLVDAYLRSLAKAKLDVARTEHASRHGRKLPQDLGAHVYLSERANVGRRLADMHTGRVLMRVARGLGITGAALSVLDVARGDLTGFAESIGVPVGMSRFYADPSGRIVEGPEAELRIFDDWAADLGVDVATALELVRPRLMFRSFGFR